MKISCLKMKLIFIIVLISVIKCALSSKLINSNELMSCCNCKGMSKALEDEIETYRPVVNKIINSLTNGQFKGKTFNELAKFVDKFGARVSGTKNLEDSIDYMLDLLKSNQLDNVHGEEVDVPHWVRGEESAELLEPRKARIGILGLGLSVPTPDEGITAEVIVLKSFDELNQPNVTSKIPGKIVVWNNDWISYGKSVKYRSQGASKASKYGAVATLVRSVTPFSMSTLHTGQQNYAEGVKKIPTASITVETAKMLQRMQDRGDKIVIKMKMSNVHNPMAKSRNVVAEIEGSAHPEKVVIVSGHIDSWDVGIGAMDDGGGAFISWYSLVVLRKLGLKPKRTVRSILWTAEEPGLYGAKGYAVAHKNETKDWVFVMESDEGTFTPLGLNHNAGPAGKCIIEKVLSLLQPINTTQMVDDSAPGSDITIWTENGIPGAALLNANDKYFWFHHTEADQLDREDPDDLDKATALFASVAYVLADISKDFPREQKSGQ